MLGVIVVHGRAPSKNVVTARGTRLLVRFVDEPTKLLGGMWAVVATVFVFRETRASALSAGLARLSASASLCAVLIFCSFRSRLWAWQS